MSGATRERAEGSSQAELILSHLRTHGYITPLEAWHAYDCHRLSARIHDLQRAGHDIRAQRVMCNGRWFAQYEFAK